MPLLLAVFLSMASVPATASAVSVEQIVALSQAGVSEDVLLALIDRDKPVFTIAPEQLVTLKQAGVSEAVVLAMLKSGRQTPATPPESTNALRLVGPEITIVGHGPDRPHASPHLNYGMLSPPEAGVTFVFVGTVPRQCAAMSVNNEKWVRVGPPAVGRFVIDPASRFEPNGVLAAEAGRADVLTLNCRTTATPTRFRSRR